MKKGLIHLPLVNEALTSPYVEVKIRATDRNWIYSKKLGRSTEGFNPLHRAIYIARESALASWIDGGMTRDRRENERDRLVSELMFLVHDYLHAWAYMVIQELVPEVRLGWGELTPASIEDHVFCHLLTEAAATVGLDYWYLSVVDLNALCDLGTRQGPLTVGYRERDLPEFQRFNPGFVVQDVAFFRQIATFYCSGVFPGFSLAHIRRSPLLLSWLEHELLYGESQRAYARAWFTHLSNGAVPSSAKRQERAVALDKPWQKRVMHELGERLWRKVKLGERETFGKLLDVARVWRRDPKLPLDFRFTNVRAVPLPRALSIRETAGYEENFGYFFSQFVSSFRFASFPSELLPILRPLHDKRDMPSLIAFFRANAKQLPSRGAERADIFFPN